MVHLHCNWTSISTHNPACRNKEQNFSKHLSPAKKAHSFPKFKFHALRTTFSSKNPRDHFEYCIAASKKNLSPPSLMKSVSLCNGACNPLPESPNRQRCTGPKPDPIKGQVNRRFRWSSAWSWASPFFKPQGEFKLWKLPSSLIFSGISWLQPTSRFFRSKLVKPWCNIL